MVKLFKSLLSYFIKLSLFHLKNTILSNSIFSLTSFMDHPISLHYSEHQGITVCTSYMHYCVSVFFCTWQKRKDLQEFEKTEDRSQYNKRSNVFNKINELQLIGALHKFRSYKNTNISIDELHNQKMFSFMLL